MYSVLGRVVIYAKDVEEAASFYSRFFGYSVIREEGSSTVELEPSRGGTAITLQPTPNAEAHGQTSIELVFDVKNIETFKAKCAKKGLNFGETQQADGYEFSIAKDPCNNLISISSKAYR